MLGISTQEEAADDDDDDGPVLDLDGLKTLSASLMVSYLVHLSVLDQMRYKLK